MPSFLHEGLLELVRKQPALIGVLLRRLFGLRVPPFREARVGNANLTELLSTEYRSDLVVMLGPEDKPVLGVVLEAQLGRDADKRFSWPTYATSLRSRHQCPVVVVVIAPNRGIARWCAKPIGLGGDSLFVPLVIGPEGIPVVTSRRVARRLPELSVLSVIAHAKGRRDVAMAIVKAAAYGIADLPEAQRVLYSALIDSALPGALGKALKMLSTLELKLKSPMYRESFEKGAAEGQAKALLRLLDRRGLDVMDAQRTTILECRDTSKLEGWLDRVLSVASVDELLGG